MSLVFYIIDCKFPTFTKQFKIFGPNNCFYLNKHHREPENLPSIPWMKKSAKKCGVSGVKVDELINAGVNEDVLT